MFSYYKLILSLHSPCGDKVHIATTCLVPCLVSFTVKKEKRNCERFRQNLNLGGAVRLPYPGTGDGDSKGPCGHESRISSHRGRFGFIKGGHWKRRCSLCGHTRLDFAPAPLIHIHFWKGSPCLPLWGNTQVLSRTEYTFVCLLKVTFGDASVLKIIFLCKNLFVSCWYVLTNSGLFLRNYTENSCWISCIWNKSLGWKTQFHLSIQLFVL